MGDIERKRRWAHKNRDHLREYNRRYYAQNKRNWQPGGIYAINRRRKQLQLALKGHKR